MSEGNAQNRNAPRPKATTVAEREERKKLARQRRIQQLEMRREVFELRKAGASYQAIADKLGRSKHWVHDVVHRELKELASRLAHTVEEYRALDLERTDAALLKLERLMRDEVQTRLVKKRVGQKWIEAPVQIVRRPSPQYFVAYFHGLKRRDELLGLAKPTKLEIRTPPERELSLEELRDELVESLREIETALVGKSASADVAHATPREPA